MNDWNFFSVVQQALVMLSILSQMAVAAKIVLDTKGAEQFVQVTAVGAGVLIFLASKALNLTFADLMYIAITDSGMFTIVLVGTVLPVTLGIFVAQATISAILVGEEFAIRIMLLIGVFTVCQIAYLNYFVLHKIDLPPEKALIPNLAYSLTVMLWIIFRYEPQTSKNSTC